MKQGSDWAPSQNHCSIRQAADLITQHSNISIDSTIAAEEQLRHDCCAVGNAPCLCGVLGLSRGHGAMQRRYLLWRQRRVILP